MPVDRNGVILDKRDSFETFKSNICHLVKYMGELDFIKFMLTSDEIKNCMNTNGIPSAFILWQ